MTNRTINPGFVPDKIIESDYKLGGISKLPKIVLVTGPLYWAPYLPKMEQQSNAVFDSFACTNFANCNCYETLHKRVFNEDLDQSDPYSANISDTVPGEGNSHNNVAEKTRQAGYIAEALFPFTKTMTQAEFFTKPSASLLEIGRKFIKEYILYGYEKVDRKDFMEAITYSPLQVAVDSQTAETKKFERFDHSVMLYGWDEKKRKWLIFDSYFGRTLEYDEDYPFGFALRFHIEKRLVPEKKESGLINFIKRLLADISRAITT